MTLSFSIQASTDADQSAIDRLLDLTFGPSRRTKTSYRLREGNHAVEGLSKVIRDSELGIVGCISYWPLVIGDTRTPAILLGPIAVHPQRQNIGIGRALMNETIAIAKSQGHDLIILVGDAPYYERVGFQQVPENRLQLPGPVDPKRLMYLELKSGALQNARGLVLGANR
jgi:predicted N-acetyltransferase YhbS